MTHKNTTKFSDGVKYGLLEAIMYFDREIANEIETANNQDAIKQLELHKAVMNGLHATMTGSYAVLPRDVITWEDFVKAQVGNKKISADEIIELAHEYKSECRLAFYRQKNKA